MEGGQDVATGIPARLSAAEGRKFGLLVGGVSAALGAFSWYRHHFGRADVMIGLGVALMLSGLLIPTKLGPLYRAWMGLAGVLSKIMTPVFMGVVYFVVLTPTGWIMKLFGKRLLKHPLGPNGYWITRPPEAQRSDLTRQF
jgi:hypothetical protein